MTIFHEFDNAGCHKLRVKYYLDPTNLMNEREIEGNIANYDELAFVEVGDTIFIGFSEYWGEKAGVYKAKKYNCQCDHENDLGGHVEMYLEQGV